MARTLKQCRARLVHCRTVAGRMAEILLSGRQVEKVGLYGSVARGKRGHWCSDVDLAIFLEDPLRKTLLRYLKKPPVPGLPGIYSFFILLLITWHAREIRRLTRGILVEGEKVRRRRPVPVSFQIFPAKPTAHWVEEFTARQRDPRFLGDVGKDLLIWDSARKEFVSAEIPWSKVRLESPSHRSRKKVGDSSELVIRPDDPRLTQLAEEFGQMGDEDDDLFDAWEDYTLPLSGWPWSRPW